MRRVLVGDVGGTNCRLALYEGDRLRSSRTVASASVSGLAAAVDEFLVDEFLEGGISIASACFGVAGPVVDGRCVLTNLGWTVEADALSAQLGAPVRLINDFHAVALAVPELTSGDSVALDELPARPDAPIVVLGAGTGLGEAFCVPSPSGWIVVPGEGAHSRFAPKTPVEMGLLTAFQQRYGAHVSVERVVSGPGLAAVYDFLRGEAPRHSDFAGLTTPAVVSRLGADGGCGICVEALEIFVDTYADEAAALALKCNAGAVYLAGGIAPRILPQLRARFRRAFEDAGRYRSLLSRVPVRVITHPEPGLLGAWIGAGVAA